MIGRRTTCRTPIQKARLSSLERQLHLRPRQAKMSYLGPPKPTPAHIFNGIMVYSILALSSRLGDKVLPESFTSNPNVRQIRLWIFWMTIVVHLFEAVYFDVARLHRAGLQRGGALWVQWMTSQICIGMPVFGMFEQALQEEVGATGVKSFRREQKGRRVRYRGWRVIDV